MVTYYSKCWYDQVVFNVKFATTVKDTVLIKFEFKTDFSIFIECMHTHLFL